MSPLLFSINWVGFVSSAVLNPGGGWRRFRSRRINAPLSRLSGLIVWFFPQRVTSLANIRPFRDASFNAGGLIGAIIARALVGGLNTIGTTILLSAIAVTGILLAQIFFC
jgi:hypothetical protein